MLKAISILIPLLIFVNLSAQDLISFTTKQGLPSNHVYDIAQDSKGFMWFATNRGVVKYDGIRFKTFTIKDGLPNNDTWRLEADNQGRIWCFSKSNYQGFIQNDSIYKFMVPDSVVITPSNISISKEGLFLYDRTTNSHIGLRDNELKKLVFKPTEGLEQLIPKTKKVLDLFKNNHVRDSLRLIGKLFYQLNPELKQYVIIINNELLILDYDFNIVHRVEHAFSKNNNFKGIDFGGMYYQTYFLISYEGILFIDHKNLSTKSYRVEELFGIKKLEYRYVKSLLHEIQIISPGYLIRVDYNFNVIEKITLSKSIPSHKSYKDNNGNIWSTNPGKGITFQPYSQLQTKQYLKGKNVQKIGQIDQSIFIGIPEDGFYEYHTNKDIFKKRIAHQYGNIYQISPSQDRHPAYFIANLSVLKYKNDKFSEVEFEMTKTIKYIVTFKDNLFVISGRKISKKNIINQKEFIIAIKQGALLGEIHENSLYIAASDGLHLIKNDSMLRPNNSHELLNTSILDLLSTKDHLIVGTDGRGVLLYNKESVIHLKNTDDLSIQKIIKKEDNLWLASQKGVYKLELDSENLANSRITDAFFEEDGLLENNTNDIFIKDNILYAASDMGLAKLDLDNSIYRRAPKLYFETPNDTLLINSEEGKNLNVSFSVLDYVNQENYNYQYRLLPHQNKWLNTKTKTLNFSNLSPNLYTVQIKASDQHGNQSIKSQYLNILPAWWQTIWAKFGFALFSILLFGGVIKGLQIQIKKREQKKAQQDKHIAGLELRALRSQMNPHFVHNSLNAIQYYIQRSEVELSEKYLVKFSKLIRLFFEYSRKQNIAVKDEVALLNNYLQIEQLRFEEKLQYKILVDEKIDQEEQLIPSMILQPIVENAVNHGLFHKQGVGSILVDFTYINEMSFQVIIKDDGIGINKAKEIFVNSAKNYQSRSSVVLKERLALLKQSNDWNIAYQIDDLSTNMDSTGTLVTLLFNQPEMI